MSPDLARRLIAVLIVLRALTNLGKPFAPGSGFVVLGHLEHGAWSTVVAPLFGLAMIGYAWLLARNHPLAWPVGIAYALWATANVVLFPLVEGVPARFAPWMYALFAVPGIVIPWLAVWLTGPVEYVRPAR
jgi:hypothetical protein